MALIVRVMGRGFCACAAEASVRRFVNALLVAAAPVWGAGCLLPYEVPSVSPKLKVIWDPSIPNSTAYMRDNVMVNEDLWGSGLERVVQPEPTPVAHARSFRRQQTTRTILCGAGAASLAAGVSLSLATGLAMDATRQRLAPYAVAGIASLGGGCLLSSVGLAFGFSAHHQRLRAIDSYNAIRISDQRPAVPGRVANPSAPSGTANQ